MDTDKLSIEEKIKIYDTIMASYDKEIKEFSSTIKAFSFAITGLIAALVFFSFVQIFFPAFREYWSTLNFSFSILISLNFLAKWATNKDLKSIMEAQKMLKEAKDKEEKKE